ncbi:MULTISPECIES: hypothetical protein [unclassified Bradyrhizobium]
MGDEADADWQAGLGEWGEDEAREYYRDILARSVRASPFRTRKKRRKSISMRKEQNHDAE